jgi:hypothetical protein
MSRKLFMARPKKPAKEVRGVVAIRLKPGVKAALQKAADNDTRPMSTLVEIVLVAWLKEHGWLK